MLTVKNPFISRDIFAHALPRLRLRIHEIKALKIYLFCSWSFTTSDNSKSCKFQAAI